MWLRRGSGNWDWPWVSFAAGLAAEISRRPGRQTRDMAGWLRQAKVQGCCVGRGGDSKRQGTIGEEWMEAPDEPSTLGAWNGTNRA